MPAILADALVPLDFDGDFSRVHVGYLDKILSINAVPEAGRLMLTGVIIVAAVLTQRRQRN